MKRFSLLLPFLPIFFMMAALTFLGRSTDFGVQKISANFPYKSEWEVQEPIDLDFDAIFSEPFTYLGNGAQCYAFESADRRHVLKFFKMKTLTPALSGKLLPFGKFKEKNARHEKRLNTTFLACKLAFEHLKEETGLVYVHLNATQQLKKSATLIDKQGNRYTVQLDKTPFFLQKKAEMVYKRIGQQIKAGDPNAANASLRAVLTLVAQRNGKGFSDIDTGISRNYGFVGDKPIHFDFLCLVQQPDDQEVYRIETKMRAWLLKHYAFQGPG